MQTKINKKVLIEGRIEKFLEQGNFNQAHICLNELDPNRVDPIIQGKIRFCLQKLARKFWRQERADEFANIMKQLGAENELQLAHARLVGKEALLQLAKMDKLACCYVQDDLKNSLISLRQDPDFKLYAEGCIALLRGDYERANQQFLAAESIDSVRAGIGLGIVALMQKRFQEAERRLSYLRPFAARKFPTLAKALGWDNPTKSVGTYSFKTLLFTAGFEDLLAEEHRTLPGEVQKKGWLWLKIGDCYLNESLPKAIASWSKAVKLCPALELDVLKRRYLASYQNTQLNLCDTFSEFYWALAKQSPAEAKSFVEFALFDSGRGLGEHISALNDMAPSVHGFLTSPLLELKLLGFTIAYADTIQKLITVMGIASRDIAPERQQWPSWKLFLDDLDPQYSNKESYLFKRLAIARYWKQSDEIRSTVKQLVKLNPHLKEEVLPFYIIEMNKHVGEDSKHYREVEELRALFPTDFDLIMLSARFKGIYDYAVFHTQLSEPLLALCCLQRLLDIGKSLRVYRKQIPSSALLLQSNEASWRLLALLSRTSAKFPKKELQVLFNLLAPDAKTKHEFCKKILAYYGEHLPISILEKWQWQNVGDWRPQYHKALYYQTKNDKEKFIGACFKARYLIGADESEFAEINQTLDHYLPVDNFLTNLF